MRLTRRELLRGGGVTAAATLLSGCGFVRELLVDAPPPAPWPIANDSHWHALNRMTFGPQAAERARVTELGLDAWIEEQLAPETLDDLDAVLRVRGFDTLTMDTSIIFDVREENVRRELQQAALLRAVYSRRQLYEVMVEFWSDHFHISILKDYCSWLKVIDDRDVIRPHALGKFRDLLWASMHSPAMLFYLDNQENHAGSPNENYARELMELHTLGVGGGYTQQDVQEVARCLTGWSVQTERRRGQFYFAPEQHDDGTKTVLGLKIAPGGGKRDGEQVYEQLLSHPALPQFIAAKLVRRFVADEPPASLVAAAARAFTHTHGDIKAVLSTILHSAEFAAAPPRLKRPFHYVAGALRQLNVETDGGAPLLRALTEMGQPPFEWSTPNGYPDESAAWGNNLLPRWRFAYQLAAGGLEKTTLPLNSLLERAAVQTPAALLDRLSTLLLGGPLPPSQRQAVLAQLGDDLNKETAQLMLAVLLASPAYQWR